MKQYIIIDTESNGPDQWAEVWHIAWQTVDPHFAIIKADGGYLTPIARMKTKAMDITGLDRKTLNQQAEPADELYSRLLHDLRGCKAVIGHSVEIDIQKICHDASRRCSPELAADIKKALKQIPYYDTASHTLDFAGKKLMRYKWLNGQLCYQTRIGYPSLDELANKLGVDRNGITRHSADGDVELTRRCLVALQESCRYLLRDLGNGKKAQKIYPTIF